MKSTGPQFPHAFPFVIQRPFSSALGVTFRCRVWVDAQALSCPSCQVAHAPSFALRTQSARATNGRCAPMPLSREQALERGSGWRCAPPLSFGVIKSLCYLCTMTDKQILLLVCLWVLGLLLCKPPKRF